MSPGCQAGREDRLEMPLCHRESVSKPCVSMSLPLIEGLSPFAQIINLVSITLNCSEKLAECLWSQSVGLLELDKPLHRR